MNIKLSSLNKGLVGHWTMSQDSLKGSLLADKTPYSNDGTIYGATFATDRMGQPNKAMSFNGVDDYIDCGNDESLDITDEITISAWINPLVLKEEYILSKHRADQVINGYNLLITSSSLYFRLGTGVRNQLDIPHGFSIDSWYFITATWNGVTMKLYSNTIKYSIEKDLSGNMLTNTNNINIGRRIDGRYTFDGSIDDVRIYNRALSEEEIKTLYNSYNPNIKMKTSLPKIKLYGGDKDIKADGFIRVDKNINNSIYFDNPESNLYGKQYFYAMQYQARDNGGVPQSTGTGLPWVSINQIDAKAKALLLGEKYHLMTNWEWMAIARDIEQVAENWTGGAVGNGVIKKGNVGITDAGSYDGDDPETGILNDKAILKLSNGEEIYHFSGNVWELVDDTIPLGNIPSKAEWTTYNTANASPSTYYNDYLPKSEVAPLGSYTENYAGGAIYYGSNTNNPRAFRRGGYWGNGANAGVFALNVNNSPKNLTEGGGFRCARYGNE